ncbi:SET domain-containing protein [Clavulina sp. PMI_390]|nr:SET domain-containing protein [Clavulina sp. PMI_390]
MASTSQASSGYNHLGTGTDTQAPSISPSQVVQQQRPRSSIFDPPRIQRFPLRTPSHTSPPARLPTPVTPPRALGSMRTISGSSHVRRAQPRSDEAKLAEERIVMLRRKGEIGLRTLMQSELSSSDRSLTTGAHILRAMSHPPRPTLNWDVEWGELEDVALMLAVHQHGYGRWRQISADPILKDKIFLGPSTRIPNAIVIKRRVDYLLGLLGQGRKAPSTSSSAPSEKARTKLSSRWTKLAALEGAASITFVNDVDTQKRPQGMRDFVYLEGSFDTSIIKFPDMLRPESCNSDCCSFSGPDIIRKGLAPCRCTCIQKRSFRHYLYDSTGTYTFLDDLRGSSYGLECHKFCKCDKMCPNRRSQWPRSVPLEIFKLPYAAPAPTSSQRPRWTHETDDRGWGVRPSVALPRGHVLGFFTGQLVHQRATNSSASKEEDQTYIFDLDGETDGGLYAVNASKCGNWSRFLNHSCDPNMIAVPVAVDANPIHQLPRLVFVAYRDIKPHEELTIDYFPDDVPGFAPCCRCGSPRCRLPFPDQPSSPKTASPASKRIRHYPHLQHPNKG